MVKFDFTIPTENKCFASDIRERPVSTRLTFIGKLLRRRVEGNRRDGESSC